MPDVSIFHLYRYLLSVVVGTYVCVRLGALFWRWEIGGRTADRREVLFRRYLVTLFLRARVKRFWFEFTQIAVLLAVLAYLIHLHHGFPSR